MTPWRWLARSVVAVGLALLASAFLRPSTGSATVADVLDGEADSSAQPLISALQQNATNAIAPLTTSLQTFNLDLTRDDFASGAADYAVTELPLTTGEAATAASNGRSFAYVPFAVTGVALGAVVAQSNDRTVQPTTFYRSLKLNPVQVADLFTSTVTQWNDAALVQPGASQPLAVTSQSAAVTQLFLVDPNAATQALISYILSQPDAAAIWNKWVVQDQNGTANLAAETWPTHGGLSGGDYTLASKLVPIDPGTNAPLLNPQEWGQGDVGPVPVEWVGAPRNIPTVALQNAAGAYVGPTVAAETADLADAAIDTKTNLVTFKSSATDTQAYPLPVMEYLVVPTSGLSAAKAQALAGFIHFVLGFSGQAVITRFGAAPVNTALNKAGLAVADAVAAQGTATTSTSTSTSSPTGSSASSTTTPTTASTTSTTVGGSAGLASSATGTGGAAESTSGSEASNGGTAPGASASTGSTATGGAGAGQGLAFTGGGWTAAGIGGSLILAGTLGRRLFARRLRAPATRQGAGSGLSEGEGAP